MCLLLHLISLQHLLLLFLLLPTLNAQTLTIGTQPALAVGGSEFGTQPVVNILDSFGNLDTTFQGSVYATLQESVSGFEFLWYQGSSTNLDNVVPFVDGKATFTGLTLNEAGAGYVLRFIGLNSISVGFAYVDSSSFETTTGSAYQISITTYPGTATGGTPFTTQPVVSVQDRGGNVIPSHNTGKSFVSVEQTVDNAPLLASGGYSLEASFYQGKASFTNLYINQAGGPYTLKFTTDLVIGGTSSRTSFPFTVGIGAAHSMMFVDDVSAGEAYGGIAFTHQPELRVLDAGLNILTGDSSSIVTATILDNPSAGSLSPIASSSVILKKGIAVFNNLAINYAGLAYMVSQKKENIIFFSTFSTNPPKPPTPPLPQLQYSLSSSTVKVVGAAFDVIIGLPIQLLVTRAPDTAWAGGQPFQVQPYITLADAGGNVIDSDESTVIQCTLVPSLAANKKMVINTVNEPLVTVTDVSFVQLVSDNAKLRTFGPGNVVTAEVFFTQEVSE